MSPINTPAPNHTSFLCSLLILVHLHGLFLHSYKVDIILTTHWPGHDTISLKKKNNSMGRGWEKGVNWVKRDKLTTPPKKGQPCSHKISPENITYRMVTEGKKTVLYIWRMQREEILKVFIMRRKKKMCVNCVWWWMLTSLVVMIDSQYIFT